MKKSYVGLSLALVFAFSHRVAADPAVVEAVDAKESDSGWTFAVTLSHGDTGWEDYADGWRVVLEGGAVLGTRELLHPHVDEQPFTRTLSGVAISGDVETVFIEARTNVDGWGPSRFRLDLKPK